jgi:hypothetical protein
LESIKRQTGIVPDELADAVPAPEYGLYLWEYYCQIRSLIDSKTRKAMTAQDVQDFCWFYAVELELWERIALRRIDLAFMGADSD